MATVRKKVTAGYRSCTGSGTMPVLRLRGAGMSAGVKFKTRSKHRDGTMVLAHFTKDAFPSAAGKDAHRIRLSAVMDPGPAIIEPHVLGALSAASDQIPACCSGLCFLKSFLEDTSSPQISS